MNGYTANPVNYIDPLGLITSSDAKKLGKILRGAGQGPENDDTEVARHIVMYNSMKWNMLELRAYMKDNRIGINGAANGIYLPRSPDDRLGADDLRIAHAGEVLHGDGNIWCAQGGSGRS